MQLTDFPHLTVAAVIERSGSYLMVREQSEGQMVYNQPAGHVEPGESLAQAAIRETLQETGWHVSLRHVLGIYQFTSDANGISYVRVCFAADAVRQEAQRKLDEDIVEVCWMTQHELTLQSRFLRSPMVMRAIEDYERGTRYPLNLVQLL